MKIELFYDDKSCYLEEDVKSIQDLNGTIKVVNDKGESSYWMTGLITDTGNEVSLLKIVITE